MSNTHASIIRSKMYSTDECNQLLLNLSICDELTIPYIKAFASVKVDMNILDEDGESAIHYAVRNKRLQLLRTLHNYSGDIHNLNAKGLKPIHYAGMISDPRYVDYFIDQGVDINDQGNSTKTPLMFASFGGSADIVEHIITLGADMSVQDKDESSWSCLHIAIAGDNSHAVKTLLQMDADPNMTSDDNISPLHFATIHEQLESIKLLLEFGADKYAYTIVGETAWDLATSAIKKQLPHLKA